MEYYFDEIESCEKIGDFDEEYVYDIEVDDDTHTFIANDILVHNSVYISFKPVLDSCDWKDKFEDEVEFISALNEKRLQKYIKIRFEEYAKSFNTDDLQALEMETISRSGLMIAKKKYILDKAWTDSGVRYGPQEKLKPVGVEIVQASTPKFARDAQKEMLNLLLSKGKNIKYQEIIAKLRKYKNEFKLQKPDDLAQTKSIGDYEKFVFEDKREIKLKKGCPINVRAAAIYNHSLLNSKYKSKYNLIKTGDKLKYYYAKGKHNVYGFVPGNFPVEIACEIDYDMQFEKVLVEPVNRYIETMGFKAVPGHLMFSTALF